MKLKIDGDGIKTFFKDNVEKLALLFCAAFLGLFTWKAIGREPYTKTPLQLQQQSQAAKKFLAEQDPIRFGEQLAAQLKNSNWNDANNSVVYNSYSSEIEKSIEEINGEDYHVGEITPALWPTGLRRGTPILLPPVELQVAAINSGLVVRAANGNEKAPPRNPRKKEGEGIREGKVMGVSVVAVTAFVPLADQVFEYHRAFGEARHQKASDTPSYVGFIPERAEVVNGETQSWQPLDVNSAIQAEGTWAGKRADVVDEAYVHGVLTRPRPPLVPDGFSSAAIAHPRVWQPPAVETDEPTQQPTQPVVAEAPKPAANAPMGVLVAEPKKDPKERPGSGDPKATPEKSKGPSGRLFRFFDFAVLPGKVYRYRVKLVLRNPNFEVAPEQLEKHEYANEQYLSTDPSEPSPMVGIPGESEVIAGNVIPAKGQKEIQGELIVKTFSRARGRELLKKFSVERGKLADQEQTDVGCRDPVCAE